MKRSLFLAFSLASSFTAAFAPTTARADSPLLQPEAPIPLKGKAGGFDYLVADPVGNRILASHPGVNTLEIIDLKTGQPLPPIQVGQAHGVDVDSENHRYFVGTATPKSVIVIDSNTLTKSAQIPMEGPIDGIAYDSKRQVLYAAHGDGTNDWAVDCKENKVVANIDLPGNKPECIVYDSTTDRFYQNIEDKNVVVMINPDTQQVDATWSTLPVTSPKGIAIDSKRGRLYSAGTNGKVVSIDIKTGNVISTADISPNGVDQIDFDPGANRLYCACKEFISIVSTSDEDIQNLGSVPSAKGMHTLAVDPGTHDVWGAFSDKEKEHSYLQRFKFVQ